MLKCLQSIFYTTDLVCLKVSGVGTLRTDK